MHFKVLRRINTRNIAQSLKLLPNILFISIPTENFKKPYSFMVFSGKYRNATLGTNGSKRNIYLLLKQGWRVGKFTVNCYFKIFLYSCRRRFNSWYRDYYHISADHHWTFALLALLETTTTQR